MKKLHCSSILFGLLFGTFGTCGAWQVHVDGGIGSDLAREIVLDSSGYLYAVGNFDTRFAVVKRVAATGAPVWEKLLPDLDGNADGEGRGYAIAVAPDGGIIAGGWLEGGFTAAKLDPAQGSVVWLYHLPVGFLFDLAVDAGGDVLASGIDDQSLNQMLIVKIDGATGNSIWETRPPGWPNGYGRGSSIALDAVGHPIVTADNGADLGGAFGVMKLDTLTGAHLWTTPLALTAGDWGPAVKVNSSGDAIAGSGDAFPGPVVAVIEKLDGTTGSGLWQYEPSAPPDSSPISIAITSVDDVIVAARDADHALVARVDGGTGAEVWLRAFPYSGPLPGGFFSILEDVVVDENDDVYVGGYEGSVTVRKLSGTDGAPVWQTFTPGVATSLVYEGGFVYVGGYVDRDMLLVRLDAGNGHGAGGAGRVGGPVPDFFFKFIPIWDNPILWVFGYVSRSELVEAIREAFESDPLMGDAVLTRNPLALVRQPDELVILLPTGARQEVLAVATAIVFRDEIFGGRTAPCVLLFENGGPGQQLIELAIKLGLWGLRG